MPTAPLNRCCERALTHARLCDIKPTVDDLAFLFGITPRWVVELRRRGVLPDGETLPQLVKRMEAYRPEAKGAAFKARRAAR